MKKFVAIAVLGILIGSCSDGNGGKEKEVVEKALMSNTQKHKLLISKIDSLESVFYGDSLQLNTGTSGSLMKAYISFTNEFPADKELSPEYLYKAAALARANKLPVKAIKYYSRIENDYPGYIKSSEAAFLLAFTYDEDLNQKEQAKEAYQYVVDKYPGDMWAIQSEERLKTIDMSDEELVNFFKQKNNIE